MRKITFVILLVVLTVLAAACAAPAAAPAVDTAAQEAAAAAEAKAAELESALATAEAKVAEASEAGAEELAEAKAAAEEAMKEAAAAKEAAEAAIAEAAAAAEAAVEEPAAEAGEEEVTLTVMVFESPALTAEYWDTAIETTLAELPDYIKVEKITSPNLDRDAYAKQLQATDQFPDVPFAVTINDFAQAGLFMPFDEDYLQENFIVPDGSKTDGVPITHRTAPGSFPSSSTTKPSSKRLA